MGFGGTRMDDIAKAAGVSRPLLYHYFPNKHDLLVEVGRDSTVAFRSVLDAVRALPERWQHSDLERLASAFLAYMDDHGSVLSTWNHATWNDEQLRDLGVSSQLRSFTSVGEELARVRGSTPIPPMQEGMVVLGMIERLWYYARVGGAPISDDALMAAVTHELADRLRRQR